LSQYLYKVFFFFRFWLCRLVPRLMNQHFVGIG